MVAMFPYKDEKDIAKLLLCSSILEEKVFEIYKRLSEKVRHPLVKALFAYIAYDSRKHSVFLKGIDDSITRLEITVETCVEEGILGDEIWKTVKDVSEEISKEETLDDNKVIILIDRLTDFESVISEEYFILVQLKTLEFIAEEIHQRYDVDLESWKDIFERIIKDEESHREILLRVKNLMQTYTPH